MDTTPPGASIDEVSHHIAEVNGTELHYVRAGESGSPVVLVHGFPETWWTFRGVIPQLASAHRVFAVDLRGFGDSATGAESDAAAVAAEDLHALIEELGCGPVHLSGQDLSGMATFRLAMTRPGDLLSYTAIESALPGFGGEVLADPGRGGAWYVGALATPGIADLLFRGRERAFIADYLLPFYGAVAPKVSDTDVAEFVRTYAREDGLHGASAHYRCLLHDGEQLRALAGQGPVSVPVMTIGSAAGDGVRRGISAATGQDVRSVFLEGVGHYAALEAPEAVSQALLEFFADVDRSPAAV